MNTLADQRASNAFVATLRDEPSTASIQAAFTQKASRQNTLRVDGLGAAIAAAEEAIRERVRSSSRPDMFEALLDSEPSSSQPFPTFQTLRVRRDGSPLFATDDASGPALYQPYIPTPVPPRSSTLPPPPPQAMLEMSVPARVPSIVVLDPQTFYHPAPPATRAPARRGQTRAGAFAIAFLVPLVLFALLIGGITYAKSRKADRGTAVGTTSLNAAVLPAVEPPPAPVVTPLATPAERPAVAEPMLVVEVKALKSVPAPRKSRR